jgi:hypothetical protein
MTQPRRAEAKSGYRRSSRIVVRALSAIMRKGHTFVCELRPAWGENPYGKVEDAHDFKTYAAAGAWCDEQQKDPGEAYDFVIEVSR